MAERVVVELGPLGFGLGARDAIVFLAKDAGHSAELVAEPARDLGLQRNGVAQRLLDLQDLQVPVGVAADELHRHGRLSAAAPDAALDHEQCPGFLDDLRHGPAGIGEGGRAGDDLEIREAGKIGNERLRNALAQIAERGIASQILERQDDDHRNALTFGLRRHGAGRRAARRRALPSRRAGRSAVARSPPPRAPRRRARGPSGRPRRPLRPPPATARPRGPPIACLPMASRAFGAGPGRWPRCRRPPAWQCS